MIDTVVYKIPPIPTLFADKITNKMKIFDCVDGDTGELLYRLKSGQLKGSFDYSISVKVNKDNSIRVECSLHKLILGHNICYGSDNLILLTNCLKKILQKLLDVKLPDVLQWEVKKLDYAVTFDLGKPEYVENFLIGLKNAYYARRHINTYGNTGIHIPGTTTTVKFYNKLEEFKKHDLSRLNKVFGSKKVDKLISLSKNMVRIEVSIKSKKLKDSFPNSIYKKQIKKEYEKVLKKYGCKSDAAKFIERKSKTNIVTVKDIQINVIKKIWESEVFKIMSESKNLKLINKSNLVVERLNKIFKTQTANSLYGFWTILSTNGEEHAKKLYSSSTFYRYRKHLINSGISWRNTDVQIVENHNVINFMPRLDSKFAATYNTPDFEFKENIFKLLKVV